jgi:hypothetical protein
MTAPMSELFMAICQWCDRLGGAPLNKHDGCWEGNLTFRDMPVTVSINGHREEHPSRVGMPVPKYSALVTVNGWPAILCNPFGGAIMGSEEGYEDALIAAFNAEASEE